VDRTKQPIAIDLAPSADRTCIVVILRSDAPIGIQQAIGTIEEFTKTLREKFPASQIDVIQNKIIV
jgi:hypothetical protein